MKTLIRTGKTILLDDDDLERVLQFELEWKRYWHVDVTGHVAASLRGYCVQLGRFILNCNNYLVVDHINRNPLDNQKTNLRAVSRSVDRHNSKTSHDNPSGCRGVCWDRFNDRWLVSITIAGKRKALGGFTKLTDAIKARKDAEHFYQKEICLPIQP